DTVSVAGFTSNPQASHGARAVRAPPLREVTAGSPLSFVVMANDPDGNAIASLSGSGLPTGSSFTANGSNTSGTFQWTPGPADAGEYDVVFSATNALSGASVTHIRVASAPSLTIDPLRDVTVAAGGS